MDTALSDSGIAKKSESESEDKNLSLLQMLLILVKRSTREVLSWIELLIRILTKFWVFAWRTTASREGVMKKLLTALPLLFVGLGFSLLVTLLSLFLVLLIPLYILVVVIAVPVSIVAAISMTFVAVDKLTYPDLSLDKEWVDRLNSENVQQLTEDERGALLAESIVRPLEHELGRPYGYIVNDIAGLQFFDNTVSRQERVAFATAEMLGPFTSRASAYGSNDETDADLEKANSAANFSRDTWGSLGASFLPVGSSEEQFALAVKSVHRYADRLRQGEAKFNMNPCDLVEIMGTNIDSVLQKTYGQVVDTEKEVPFDRIDDHVYALVGNIRPVYYQTYTLKQLFPDMFKDTAMNNMDQAIEVMGRVMNFNPEVVLPGMSHGAGLSADHRANLARLVSDVRHRLTEVKQSIPANCKG